MKPILPLITALLLTSLAALHAADQPNIVVFPVDDMGWMDSGAYFSTYLVLPKPVKNPKFKLGTITDGLKGEYIVKALDALINGFLKNAGTTYPRPNPAYEPAKANGTPQ